jgi:hypothetical protein
MEADPSVPVDRQDRVQSDNQPIEIYKYFHRDEIGAKIGEFLAYFSDLPIISIAFARYGSAFAS